MKKRVGGVASLLAVGVLSMATMASAQQKNAASVAPGLTALDYIEIQQLVYRYGWALDSGAENGYAYADLYASDGTFTGTNQGPSGRTYQGRDALAALARGGKRSPTYVSHYVANVVIEPSPDGAVGRSYVGIFEIGNGGNGAASKVDHGGLYNDVYVKTAAGWRFRSRSYYESRSGDPVQPPPALLSTPIPFSKVLTASPSSPQKGLSADDYVEIQQLVSRYPFALDGDTDNGVWYANLFTADAVFRQPKTEGHEALAKLAMTQPHGARFVRHFITNHVIDATPDGATGKEYLLVIDIGENGMPSAVFLGGHYEDTYAKTPQGWRFKSTYLHLGRIRPGSWSGRCAGCRPGAINTRRSLP